MAIETQTLNYTLGETEFKGLYAFDNAINKNMPTVLVAPTWRGCDALAAQQAKEIAKLGYIGVAIDMYGNGTTGSTPDECAALMQVLMDDREMLQSRIVTALKAVKKIENADPGKTAAIGYCLGGLCVLDLARSGAELKGVVSVHGMFSQPDLASKLSDKVKILILHGHEDPLAPPGDMQALIDELNTSKADWEINLYGNTAHAFTNPQANLPDQGLVFNQYAKDRAWNSVSHFLQNLFKH